MSSGRGRTYSSPQARSRGAVVHVLRRGADGQQSVCSVAREKGPRPSAYNGSLGPSDGNPFFKGIAWAFAISLVFWLAFLAGILSWL